MLTTTFTSNTKNLSLTIKKKVGRKSGPTKKISKGDGTELACSLTQNPHIITAAVVQTIDLISLHVVRLHAVVDPSERRVLARSFQHGVVCNDLSNGGILGVRFRIGEELRLRVVAIHTVSGTALFSSRAREHEGARGRASRETEQEGSLAGCVGHLRSLVR